jgi:hypothetical protein
MKIFISDGKLIAIGRNCKNLCVYTDISDGTNFNQKVKISKDKIVNIIKENKILFHMEQNVSDGN